MKAFSVFILAAPIFCCAIEVPAQTWVQTSAPTNGWLSIASSADAQKLVATASQSYYTSADGGLTWISNNLPSLSQVASSADGSHLIAAAYTGGIYTSSDSGATWVSNNLPQTSFCAASSADGKKLVAVDVARDEGLIFTSTNSGMNWMQATNAPITWWTCVDSSADGNKLVVCPFDGAIYQSTNAGVTWKVSAGGSGEYFTCVASSADGKIQVAVQGGGNIIISPNSIWRNAGAPFSSWSSIACSADGTKLVAASSGYYSGLIYSSTNSGKTWISNSVPKLNWYSVAMSADGNKSVAVAYNGGIWISQTTPAPKLSLTTTNGLQLSWMIPSTDFVLQQNSDLNTADWITLTDAPVLNFTNLQNQLMLSPTNASSFYRLATP